MYESIFGREVRGFGLARDLWQKNRAAVSEAGYQWMQTGNRSGASLGLAGDRFAGIATVW